MSLRQRGHVGPSVNFCGDVIFRDDSRARRPYFPTPFDEPHYVESSRRYKSDTWDGSRIPDVRVTLPGD